MPKIAPKILIFYTKVLNGLSFRFIWPRIIWPEHFSRMSICPMNHLIRLTKELFADESVCLHVWKTTKKAQISFTKIRSSWPWLNVYIYNYWYVCLVHYLFICFFHKLLFPWRVYGSKKARKKIEGTYITSASFETRTYIFK